jgi:hypothetical protein
MRFWRRGTSNVIRSLAQINLQNRFYLIFESAKLWLGKFPLVTGGIWRQLVTGGIWRQCDADQFSSCVNKYLAFIYNTLLYAGVNKGEILACIYDCTRNTELFFQSILNIRNLL